NDLAKLKEAEDAEIAARKNLGEVDPEIDPAVHARRLAEIERRNKPFATPRPRGVATDEDILKVDVDKIKRQFREVEDSYKDLANIMQAQERAGVVDVQEGFTLRSALAKAEAAERIAGLEQQNVLLRQYNEQHKGVATESKHILDNTKEINRNEEQIASIRNREAATQTTIRIDTEAYQRSLIAGYRSARLEAEELLRVTTAQHDRDLEAVALSDRQRGDTSGRSQINEAARAARQRAEDDRELLIIQGRFNKTEEDQYNRRISIIDEFQRRSLGE